MKRELVAKTLVGFETVLADELQALGAEEIKIGNRAVTFKGDMEMIYKANLWLRTAIRILMPIHSFKAVNEEELYIAWGLYIEELRKTNNHSGVSNFKSALLNIIDNNCIEIITENNIQQKFVETERATLIGHLQAHFNNRYLTYRVVVVENKNNSKIVEEYLSTKEQYLRIIEEYPLVKQLKDKLGLQLYY